MSGRFTVIFMAWCPTPSARNLLFLYVPGCWRLLQQEKEKDAESLAVALADGSAFERLRQEQFGLDVFAMPHYGSEMDSNGNQLADPELHTLTANVFTRRVYKILQGDHPDWGACRSCGTVLGIEIAIIPFACSVIIPIGISAFSLAWKHMKAGLRSTDGSDQASAGDDLLRKKMELFLQTVSIVEALLESLPQLALQVWAGAYGGNLTEWVFIFTVSVSSASIAKAIVVFFLNRKGIWETFRGLQGRVLRFQTRDSSYRYGERL